MYYTSQRLQVITTFRDCDDHSFLNYDPDVSTKGTPVQIVKSLSKAIIDSRKKHVDMCWNSECGLTVVFMFNVLTRVYCVQAGMMP